MTYSELRANIHLLQTIELVPTGEGFSSANKITIGQDILNGESLSFESSPVSYTNQNGQDDFIAEQEIFSFSLSQARRTRYSTELTVLTEYEQLSEYRVWDFRFTFGDDTTEQWVWDKAVLLVTQPLFDGTLFSIKVQAKRVQNRFGVAFDTTVATFGYGVGNATQFDVPILSSKITFDLIKNPFESELSRKSFERIRGFKRSAELQISPRQFEQIRNGFGGQFERFLLDEYKFIRTWNFYTDTSITGFRQVSLLSQSLDEARVQDLYLTKSTSLQFQDVEMNIVENLPPIDTYTLNFTRPGSNEVNWTVEALRNGVGRSGLSVSVEYLYATGTPTTYSGNTNSSGIYSNGATPSDTARMQGIRAIVDGYWVLYKKLPNWP
jgi:hypothetical protein